MKLRLYKCKDGYSFSIGKFSSLNNYYLIPKIKPVYKYAWQANKMAKYLYNNKNYHIVMSEIEEDKETMSEVEFEAEEKIIERYKNLLKEMDKTAFGIDDDDEEEKEKTYQILKSQVTDLLRLKNLLTDNENPSKYVSEIENIINGYKKIARKNFSKYLNQDKQNLQSEEMPEIEDEETKEDIPDFNNLEDDNFNPEENLTLAMSKINKLSSKLYFKYDDKKEILDHYGELICKKLSNKHPDIINKSDVDNLCIDFVTLDDGECILRAKTNDHLLINNIYSCNKLKDTYPSYSNYFYQKYWKPIVESLGHFFVEDCNCLILPEIQSLPDIPNSIKELKLEGYDTEKNKKNLKIKFNDDCWIVNADNQQKIHERYTEEDFEGAKTTLVRCIDDNLSLYGKIGEVIQTIPINAGVGFEVDVNFGRKIVRLSDEQIQIVDN